MEIKQASESGENIRKKISDLFGSRHEYARRKAL